MINNYNKKTQACWSRFHLVENKGGMWMLCIISNKDVLFGRPFPREAEEGLGWSKRSENQPGSLKASFGYFTI